MRCPSQVRVRRPAREAREDAPLVISIEKSGNTFERQRGMPCPDDRKFTKRTIFPVSRKNPELRWRSTLDTEAPLARFQKVTDAVKAAAKVKTLSVYIKEALKQ